MSLDQISLRSLARLFMILIPPTGITLAAAFALLQVVTHPLQRGELVSLLLVSCVGFGLLAAMGVAVIQIAAVAILRLTPWRPSLDVVKQRQVAEIFD